MSSKSARQRKWLREASMRRLSQLVKDKTELIDSAQKLRINISSVDGLEASGLNKQMIQHLENWVEGVESGRECMFALLDSMHNTKDIAPPAKASQFKPIEVVQSLLNLPEQFLCDNGYLFEKVFSRPPATVVKEAVAIIVKKAEEQNSSSLGLQQINLALKQLRLDAMCSSNPIVEPVALIAQESVTETVASDESLTEKAVETEPLAIDDHLRQQITMRVKIITELLRIHIKTTTKRKQSSQQQKRRQPHRAFTLWDETVDEDTDELVDVDLRSLREFVNTPVQQVQQQAMESPAEFLELTNSLLKPYLRRLSALKVLLSSQLNEIRDSKAFLSLGLSPDATDEDIKKAYRILAVRLHPDKPGGDTAKFQQLQAMYQEVLKRRKTKRDEEETVKQMREKRQQEQSHMRNQRHRKQTQQPSESKDNEEEDAFKASLEQEDKELEELLRNIDKDLQKDAEEMAAFVKQKKELKRKGGLSTDKDDNEDLASSTSFSDEEEKETEKEDDKENLQDGSENEASSTSSEKDKDSDQTKKQRRHHQSPAVDTEPASSQDTQRDTRHRSTTGENLTVEDVDSDDDTDLAQFTKQSLHDTRDTNSCPKTQPHGSRFAAQLLNVTLPEKPLGPFDSDETHAAALIAYTQQLLPVLHHAATRATQTTQRLVKWQKQWDKTFKDSSLSLSQLMEQLLQSATQALGGHVSFIEHISCLSLSSTSTETQQDNETQRRRLLSSLVRAVAPALEVVCDVTQRVAASAMELATDCGADYAQTIGFESDFLKDIEETMNESLACLRGVVPIATCLDQLMACLQRSYDTQRLYSAGTQPSTSLLDMLTEMMRTALKNTVATHCGAVDSLMQAAQAATHLTDRLKCLQEKVSRHVLLEAKRQADYERMRQEEEDEYSAEDREAMKRARHQQQQPPPAASSSSSSSQSTDEESEKKKREQEEEEENEKHLSGLDLLKNKIRKLQVQLYLQQVAALQTMNAETVTLQDNILQELQSLTLLVPPAKSQNSPNSPTSAIQGVNSGVVESVVSLVAEMLDASLAQFRVVYQRHRPSLLLQDTLPTTATQQPSEWCTQDDVNWELRRHLDLEYVSDTLKKQLDWCLSVVLSDFSHVSLKELLVQAKFVSAVSSSSPIEEDADDSEQHETASSEPKPEPKPVQMMPKMALLPDYRAKTLYLASVLDLPAVKHLLFAELPQKLEEILSE